MRISLSLNQQLTSIFWQINKNVYLRDTLLVIGGSLLLAVASKIAIPLTSVPVTLQTLAIFFIGMTYGWKLGTTTVLVYLLAGLIGTPVFAEPMVGLPILLGPTGGYLIGFIPAVCLSGYLAERGFARNPITVALAAIIGSVPLYLLGVGVLATFVGASMAISVGFKPFILGDLLKIIFLACVIPAFWRVKENKLA